MLKGSRHGILRRIQPVSIHGQISMDVSFSEVDGPEERRHVARLGPEAIANHLEPGDHITVEYLVGVAVRVTRSNPSAA